MTQILLKVAREQEEEHLSTQGWGARDGGGEYHTYFCFCGFCLPSIHSPFPKGESVTTQPQSMWLQGTDPCPQLQRTADEPGLAN